MLRCTVTTSMLTQFIYWRFGTRRKLDTKKEVAVDAVRAGIVSLTWRRFWSQTARGGGSLDKNCLQEIP